MNWLKKLWTGAKAPSMNEEETALLASIRETPEQWAVQEWKENGEGCIKAVHRASNFWVLVFGNYDGFYAKSMGHRFGVAFAQEFGEVVLGIAQANKKKERDRVAEIVLGRVQQVFIDPKARVPFNKVGPI